MRRLDRKPIKYNPISALNLIRGFKKGHTSWQKGKKWNEEDKKKNPFWIYVSKEQRIKNSGFMSKKGQKPWNYIENRSLLKKRDERGDYAYQDWRKEVLKKFSKCFFNGDDCKGRREVHHIKSWKDYPKLRYDINNGIIFCHEHHPIKKKDISSFLEIFQRRTLQISN